MNPFNNCQKKISNLFSRGRSCSGIDKVVRMQGKNQDKKAHYLQNNQLLEKETVYMKRNVTELGDQVTVYLFG